jgi:hypothetical protein
MKFMESGGLKYLFDRFQDIDFREAVAKEDLLAGRVGAEIMLLLRQFVEAYLLRQIPSSSRSPIQAIFKFKYKIRDLASIELKSIL